MVFLFPIGHEDQTVQRMPWVTISIIVVNVFIFMVTSHSEKVQQIICSEKLGAVIEYYTSHPYLDMENLFQDKELQILKEYLPDKEEYDPADEELSLSLHESKFIELIEEYRQAKKLLPYNKYGLIPEHPRIFNYFSSMFIHGGLFHLFFNMLFLWLVGCNIEDRWGRPLYLGFYLISGIVACQAHVVMFSQSAVPLIGASGAIAGTMGAFLIRMYKTKIRIFYLIWFITIHTGTFEIPTVVALPFWLAQQLFYALNPTSANGGGVAFWSHIGGFIFGAVAAMAIGWAKIEEKYIQPQIEEEISLTQNPGIISSMENFDQGLYDEAIMDLKEVLKINPRNVDANVLLGRIYLRQEKKSEASEIYKRLISIYITDVKNNNLAIDTYFEVMKLLPELVLQPRDQVHIARFLEKEGNLIDAAKAYSRLIETYPSAHETMKAIVSYGNLCLNKLNEPGEALVVFRKGRELCHLNPAWLDVMEEGLNKAKIMVEK